MLTIRKAAERGATRIGWLDARHTFSFGDYFDPAHHHFRGLRVLNDDRIAPGGGFPTHPHRDTEILTHVLEGALEHRDSMGNGSVIRAGQWQYMRAGSGVSHSEFNASETEPVHLLQIWIMPAVKGVPPAYAEADHGAENVPGRWQLVATPDGRGGSIRLNGDAVVSAARLRPGDRVTYDFTPGRGGWLQVATGAIQVNGLLLSAGDGLVIEGEHRVEVTGTEPSEALLFDLA